MIMKPISKSVSPCVCWSSSGDHPQACHHFYADSNHRASRLAAAALGLRPAPPYAAFPDLGHYPGSPFQQAAWVSVEEGCVCRGFSPVPSGFLGSN